MTIGQKQINLINLAKNYLEKINSLNIDVAESAFCWLLNVPNSQGYFVLKNLQKTKMLRAKRVFFILKQFVGISILHNFRLLNKVNLEKNFERLIISWAKKDDLKIDGSYTDRYLKVNSKDTLKTLWFLLYQGDTIPKNINNNIVIFGKENIKEKYNFFYLIKVFFSSLKQNKSSIFKIFHLCSRSSHYAMIVSKAVLEIVNSINFKNVLIPYESQPFQNTVFKEIRKINKNIKLIGYLHATQPLPTLNIHRKGSPDVLLVHGSSQIFHLSKYLNWPQNKLRLIPSLRYHKKNIIKYNSNLVLPISLSFKKTLINQFRIFLKEQEIESLKPFVIKKHPFTDESKTQEKFVFNIKKILLEYKDRFSDKAANDISIFFGGSSSILEALEDGLNVIHICGDTILESYTEDLWPSMKVQQINDNTFRYSLRKYGNCINFGNENNMFEKYCNLIE